jgi:predicted hydrolase (HD superfamily)
MSDTETVLREFYDKAYAAGVAAERERCAKVCIEMADDFEIEVNQRGLVDRMKQHFGVK